MSLFSWQRPHCVDCAATTMLFEYATRRWVCFDCAVRYGYHEVMQSVMEWINARSTKR